MRLITFGGLSLQEGKSKPKNLLLLAYLAVEGPKTRQHLAELFFMGRANPRGSLSRALSDLRKDAPDSIEADNHKVCFVGTSDVGELLDFLDNNKLEKSVELYGGAFADGVSLKGETELEEWVWTTREYLGGRVREAYLKLAEEALVKHDYRGVGVFSELVYELTKSLGLEIVDYKRLYALLLVSGSDISEELRQECQDLEMFLPLSKIEAQNFLSDIQKSKNIVPNSLPNNKTSFVGRDQDLIEISKMLDNQNCRLITLHGVGGIGKTRLAIQLGKEQLQNFLFKDGIYYINLETVISEEQIFHYILSELSFDIQPALDVFRQLTHHIKDKHILFILDNFEQLIHFSDRISDFLQECPLIKLVVTSRVSLNLEEEWLRPLKGLSYPISDTSNFESCEAISLFVDRAQKIRPSFNLQEDDAFNILSICRLIDGLPLAVEMLAAWVNVMTLQEIYEGVLLNASNLYTSKHRNKNKRHFDMEVVFNYTWDLLSDSEKNLFCRLSVFEGDFCSNAVTNITEMSKDQLQDLIRKSLVYSQDSGRFKIHPLTKDFAKGRFIQIDKRHEVYRDRYSDYYIKMLKEMDYWGEKSVETLKVFQVEFPNIINAWKYCLSIGQVKKLEGCADIVTLFDQSMRLKEGVLIFDLTLEALIKEERRNTLYAEILVNRAWLQYKQSFYSEAEKDVLEAEKYLIESNNASLQMKVKNVAGWLHYRQNNFEIAVSEFGEALNIASEINDKNREAMYNSNLGSTLTDLGEYEKAEQYLSSSLVIYNRGHSKLGIILVNVNLGRLYTLMSQYEKSRQILLNTLEDSVAIKHEHSIPQIHLFLAENYLEEGDLEQAQTQLIVVRQFTKKQFSLDLETELLLCQARIYTKSEQYEDSRRTYLEWFEMASYYKVFERYTVFLVYVIELLISVRKLEMCTNLVQYVNRRGKLPKHNRDDYDLLVQKFNLTTTKRTSSINNVLLNVLEHSQYLIRALKEEEYDTSNSYQK